MKIFPISLSLTFSQIVSCHYIFPYGSLSPWLVLAYVSCPFILSTFNILTILYTYLSLLKGSIANQAEAKAHRRKACNYSRKIKSLSSFSSISSSSTQTDKMHSYQNAFTLLTIPISYNNPCIPVVRFCSPSNLPRLHLQNMHTQFITK